MPAPLRFIEKTELAKLNKLREEAERAVKAKPVFKNDFERKVWEMKEATYNKTMFKGKPVVPKKQVAKPK